MARNGQLDAVGCAAISGGASIRRAIEVIVLAVSLTFLIAIPVWGRGPSHSDPDHKPNFPADAEYKQGIAFAQAGDLAKARTAFLRGGRISPEDARFPTELGGIAFKQKKYREATKWLRRAQKLAPDDSYVHDLLGTVYFLEGRQDAAIAQWNRIGKPVVDDIKVQPGLGVDPVLLDRSFSFSRGETLKLADLWTTEAHLLTLAIYPMFSLRMAARANGTFDVDFRAQERDGFGGKWDALLGTFRGIFYQTITPEYYNIGGTATNVTSLWRWDTEKRRVEAAVSGPLHRNPRWRYGAGMDLRNENWDVRNFSSSISSSGNTLGLLNMRRSAGGAEITSITSGKLAWSVGGEVSYRDFRCGAIPCVLGNSQPSSVAASGKRLLTQGHQLKQRGWLTYDVLRLPEKQYRLTARAQSDLARSWTAGGSVFEKVQGELAQTWTLTDATDGPQLTNRLRAGKTFGDPPFDELFMLGVERDNPLMLRGHVGTDSAGRKGNAPLGRNYFLSNNDIDKKIWGNGLIAVRLGPFVDVGRITDPLPYLGSNKWLVDAGGQVTVRVLGVEVHLTYGRDLRAGGGAFYTWVGK